MTSSQSLRATYKAYIACLNPDPNNSELRFDGLDSFVNDDVIHNGTNLKTAKGYQAFLEGSVATYPGLHFEISMLVVDDDCQTVAAIIRITYFNKDADDSYGVLTEHVFYQFKDAKIQEVWSIVVDSQSGRRVDV